MKEEYLFPNKFTAGQKSDLLSQIFYYYIVYVLLLNHLSKWLSKIFLDVNKNRRLYFQFFIFKIKLATGAKHANSHFSSRLNLNLEILIREE